VTTRDAKRWAAIALLATLMPATSHALLESCDVSATNLVFGVYDPLNAAPHLSTGTITVQCSVTLIAVLASWDILLSRGSSASFNPRNLRSGGNTLFYNIYTSAAHSTIWGDGSGGTAKVSGSSLLLVGTNTSNYTLYGSIPVAQDRPAGAYADSIVVTLNY
jgi:spore coat protein U-like protein